MSSKAAILIELLLVFGGVSAFAWWQLRSIDRERARRREGRRDGEE